LILDQTLFASYQLRVKNPVLPQGASSKEKAILTIHPRSSGRGILAFSRKSIPLFILFQIILNNLKLIKLDGFVKIPVHPSIPQGERMRQTVSI
jgi:hypothetical protein